MKHNLEDYVWVPCGQKDFKQIMLCASQKFQTGQHTRLAHKTIEIKILAYNEEK